jgi:sec-independent protein translocase protein TatB
VFDIGFAELLLVSVVGLLVLGPERLPSAIRTASLWMGRLRRSFNAIRADIEREIDADGIKQDLHNNAVMDSLREAERDLRGTVSDLPYNTAGIGETSEPAPDATQASGDAPSTEEPLTEQQTDSEPTIAPPRESATQASEASPVEATAARPGND